jgi:hypothetical protein
MASNLPTWYELDVTAQRTRKSSSAESMISFGAR